jgi:hypothetical protein
MPGEFALFHKLGGVRLADGATASERLAFYRPRKGITQEVLARWLGRSVDCLPSLSGASKSWTGCPLVAIADRLDIEPVKLLPTAFATRRRELVIR